MQRLKNNPALTSSMAKRVVLGLVEEIAIIGNKRKAVKARIDTGATNSSIDSKLAKELDLGPIIRERRIKSALGTTVRPIVKVVIEIKGNQMEEEFNLAERGHMTYPVLIGQNILKKEKFLVDP